MDSYETNYNPFASRITHYALRLIIVDRVMKITILK